MKCASVDIGTNTLRLLIAELTEAGTLKPKLHRRFITRLGGCFTEDSGIDEQSAKRAFTALAEIKSILDIETPDVVDAVATSVVRRAKNSEWFVETGSSKLGTKIKVIDGEEEASLSLLGVASVLSETGAGKNRLVMDIGGGSTEFIFADKEKIKAPVSLELGVVYLTEKFLKSDPPKEAELNALSDEITASINELKDLANARSIDTQEFLSNAVFIGTAGTVTTLSAMHMELYDYDPDLINGTKLTIEEVEGLFDRLKKQTMRERLQEAALEKGREDLIIAGALIVLLVMKEFGFKEMTVSDAGLLEGIMLDSFKKNKGGRSEY